MSGCAGWSAVNPLCRAKQVLGGAGKAVGQDVFNTIAHYFSSAANAAVSWLWRQLGDATSIELSSPSLKTDLLATGAIAALVAFALFLIQLIASTLRQDGAGLGRAVRGLAISFIGAAFAVAATQLLLAAVDALSNGVVQFALGTNMEGLGSRLVAAATLSSIGNPAILLLLSLILICAVVIVWAALMIRKMLIIISAVFAPIAFAGASSDISRSWVRRWIEVTVALVFSKLILVIIFMIGLSVLQGAAEGSHGGNGTTNSVTNLIIGALTLLLAGFAPWLAIKTVHFAGEAFHTAHIQATSATSGGQNVVALPQKVATAARANPLGRSLGTSSSNLTNTSNGHSQPKSPSSTGSAPAAAAGSAGSSVGVGVGAAAGPATAGAAVTAVPRLASEAARRTSETSDRAIGSSRPTDGQ